MSACWTCARGDLHGDRRAKRTSSSAASSGTCSSSRTSAPSSRTGIPRTGSRARPTAPTCAWPRPASSAGRDNFVVNAYGVRSVNEGVPGRDWSYGFSAHYPNDKFNAQVAFREIQENFKPALGFVQRDNVRMLRVAGSYNPRPKDFLNIQQMFHDVYLHALHAAGQRPGRELGPLCHAPRLALQVRRQPPRDVRLQPHLRAALRAVRDLARRHPAAGRVPLHPLQEQSALDGHEAAAVGQHQPDVWQLLVGEGRAGDDEPHLQAAAAVHDQRRARTRRSRGCRKATSSPASSRPTSATRRPRRCRSRIWFSTTTGPGTWAGRAASAGRCSPATTCSSRSTRDGSRRTAGNLRFRTQDSKVSAKFQYSFRF